MPITSGAYVNPGWHNDTDPYINQTELNAISDTLEKVPVANGGTGATTAAAALTNLGAEPIANVKSKGSATTPVYFNSSGVATPITGPIPVSLGGTGASDTVDAKINLRAVGVPDEYTATNVGSATQPCYGYRSTNGALYLYPCTYTLGKSVPSNAVFTDTTALSSMTGTLSVAHGGTGVTSTSALVTALKAATLATAGSTVGGESTPVYIKDGVVTVCTNTLKTYTGTSPITVSGTAISHATSGVTAASKGDTSAQTPTWGGTFKVPSGTVNATGHLTAFADHTVTIPNKAMTGATSSAAGAVGLVPAPAKGNQSSFLRGDGNWATPTNTTYSATSPISLSGTTFSHATSGVTAASKGDTSAQTPTWGGTFKVPSGTVNATGHLTAFAEHTVKIPNATATTSAAGLMSSAMYSKLASITTRASKVFTGTVSANTEQTVTIPATSLSAGFWLVIAWSRVSASASKGGVSRLTVLSNTGNIAGNTLDATITKNSLLDEFINAVSFTTMTTGTAIQARFWTSIDKSLDIAVTAIKLSDTV